MLPPLSQRLCHTVQNGESLGSAKTPRDGELCDAFKYSDDTCQASRDVMRRLFEIWFCYDVLAATDNTESFSPEPCSCSFV